MLTFQFSKLVSSCPTLGLILSFVCSFPPPDLGEADFIFILQVSAQISLVYVWSLNCAQLFCDPRDSSSAGSSVHGILQEITARKLEWVAISFSRGSS